MASSAQKEPRHTLPTVCGATAPPPTPSTHPNPFSNSDAADALSRLLHRLTPTLSLPTRRWHRAETVPIVSLSSDRNPALLQNLLSSACELGFFQLVDHGIAPEIAASAEFESLSLFELSRAKKESYFPRNWPLGFDGDNDEEARESFCLDGSCSAESEDLSLASLREFTSDMERLGLKIVDLLSRAAGFGNPTEVQDDPNRVRSLMWISGAPPADNRVVSGGFYPYIVGLQYHIRPHNCSLLTGSGWVSVSPQVDSIIVTLGDITHVWSNGRFKKVGGRPVVCSGDDGGSGGISMCLLLTLSPETTVCPLIPKPQDDGDFESEDGAEVAEEKQQSGKKEVMFFKSFSFEEYAWKLYHERLHLKDPLDSYRV